jgi:hypothetical protein
MRGFREPRRGRPARTRGHSDRQPQPSRSASSRPHTTMPGERLARSA